MHAGGGGGGGGGGGAFEPAFEPVALLLARCVMLVAAACCCLYTACTLLVHCLYTAARHDYAFDDSRVEVHTTSVSSFMETKVGDMIHTRAGYDLIVVDLPDPRSPMEARLYTREAMEGYLRLLRGKESVLSMQATSPLTWRAAFWCIAHTLSAAGEQVRREQERERELAKRKEMDAIQKLGKAATQAAAAAGAFAKGAFSRKLHVKPSTVGVPSLGQIGFLTAS